jgi:hypothetical protein
MYIYPRVIAGFAAYVVVATETLCSPLGMAGGCCTKWRNTPERELPGTHASKWTGTHEKYGEVELAQLSTVGTSYV